MRTEKKTFKFKIRNCRFLDATDIDLEIVVGCIEKDGGKDDPDYVEPSLISFQATVPFKLTIQKE